MKMWSQSASGHTEHSGCVLGTDHINFTPIPLVLASELRAPGFDQTTRAITCKGPEGPLTVSSSISFGRRGFSQQMNAPFRLIFLVSPCILPLFVIPETDHLTCVLGYSRFSFSILAPQGITSTRRFVDIKITLCFYNKNSINLIGALGRFKKQKSCHISRN